MMVSIPRLSKRDKRGIGVLPQIGNNKQSKLYISTTISNCIIKLSHILV